MAPPKDRWVRRFVISETNRHKKGFTIYKVTSILFLKSSPDVVSKVSIWKRYSDFRKLYKILQSLHAKHHIKEPFPSFPKPKFFGRFETEVIEERKECALKFLEFIGHHNVLYSCDAFVKFFECNDADKQFLECSQSLSSDTSEDDRSVNWGHEVEAITSTTDLSKFVYTQKVTPVIVKNQRKSSKLTNIDDLEQNRGTNSHDVQPTNSNNNSYKNSYNNIVEGLENLNLKKSITEINSSHKSIAVIHDGSDLPHSFEKSAQYVLIAAAHMSAAFRHEAIAEYEEAFTQYKLGVSHLINGVQTETDQFRREIIQEKMTKYLQRAERLYNRHLNCNVSVLYKPVTELRSYKVIELMESVMVVIDVLQGFKRIIKTVAKIDDNGEDISNYILRGKVPYMVQLYSCMQTDSTVFLILQYMSKGKLWDFIRNKYKIISTKVEFYNNGHKRSLSCDAAIQIDLNEKPLIKKNALLSNCAKEEINYSSFDNYCSTPTIDDTSKLLRNAQKLLQSVNATLKRSSSIAIRLNESEHLLYKHTVKKAVDDTIYNHDSALKNDSIRSDNDDTGTSKDISDLSRSCSCVELSNKYKHKELQVKCNMKLKENIEQFKKLSNIKLNSMYNGEDNCKFESLGFNEDQSQLNKLDFLEGEQMWSIPEFIIKKWAAEILLAIEALHQQDVIISDLRPENILIDDYGHVSMTYIVPRKETELLRLKKPYSSPELCMFLPPISITTSADVWSFGVLLYEMLTGFDFEAKHPGRFHSHSLINIPKNLSENARSLLLNILQYQASDRLTIPEIKQHPFFAKINWLELLNAQM
ncbi:ribosomal protein S6 kinase delta-1 [Phymastichus coffea]|uniref:ribosomal protein S6 kinase delta-1 n=1 Tax=Phymastichus coffea TaxID=108790 RepID=UPI00273A8E48|nr:ribosomal protein S6 kinase delta-1 [Phymastichus coffea]XP_058799889.1 ribosomal protein S6 kinase delta-1 [Phymastichus coffea]XP_058799890.1 ribosomal protein S6 kinase delta-1 [Phymastichus coffea]